LLPILKKKKQKDFIHKARGGCRARAKPKEVFCFFFSKKKNGLTDKD